MHENEKQVCQRFCVWYLSRKIPQNRWLVQLAQLARMSQLRALSTGESFLLILLEPVVRLALLTPALRPALLDRLSACPHMHTKVRPIEGARRIVTHSKTIAVMRTTRHQIRATVFGIRVVPENRMRGGGWSDFRMLDDGGGG